MTEMTNEMLLNAIDSSDLNQTLLLANQDIHQISELLQNDYPKLRKLNLNHNKISKISNLSNLPHLANLQLGFNCITSTVGVENLVNLTHLNLTHNQIQQVGKIGNLKNLINLNLSFNQLSKVDFIDNLRELLILNLNGNQIQRIDFLIYNTKLEELHLQKNKLQSISAKDFQNSLRINLIDLSHNQISQTAFINNIEQLEVSLYNKLLLAQHVDLSHNRIQVYDCVKANEFKQQQVSHNIIIKSISDISIIEYKYRNLTHLLLRDNDIMTEYAMKFLLNMENLIEVEFRENPFYNQEFETKIILECPWLEIVNGKEVGKPANFRIKELLLLREEMQDMNIDDITFSDLNGEGNDIMTEEKFKAILRQKGMDSSDDETPSTQIKQNEKSALIFQDEDELQTFITERNIEAMHIRQQYLSIIHKNNKIQTITEPQITEESKSLIITQIQETDTSSMQDNLSQSQLRASREQPSMIIKFSNMIYIIRKMPKLKPRLSDVSQLSNVKVSILQEITYLKTSQNDKQFLKQIGMTNNNRIKETMPTQNSVQPNKLNVSSENFNTKTQKKIFKRSSLDQLGYKTMNNASNRGSSTIKSDKVKTQNLRTSSQQMTPLKLPQISKTKNQK